MVYSVREVFPFVWRWRSVHGPENAVGFAFSKRAAKRAAAGRHADAAAQLRPPNASSRPDRAASTSAPP